MLPYGVTLQGWLTTQVPRAVPVYGLGFSDYLATAEKAATESSPRAAVLAIIDGDISESLQPKNGHFYLRQDDGGWHLEYLTFGQPSRLRFVWDHVGESSL